MTQRRYLLDGMHPFFQIVLLASLTLVFSVLFTLLAMYLVRPLFGVTAIDTLMQDAIANPESIAANMNSVNAMKFLQGMASVGTFLIPPIVFAFLKFPDGDFLRIRRHTSLVFVVLGMFILLTSTPFIDFTYRLNQWVTFPASFSEFEKAMKESTEANEKLTLLFLKAPTAADLLINLLVIAIIPAIGEELMFRGVGQQIVREWTKNWHSAIWITAAVFSFVHMDFYGFLPRLLLGALLGYLFVWSGTLWVPIIAHAFNNGAQVLLAYLHEHGIIQYDITEETLLPSYVIIISAALCALLIYSMRQLIIRRRFIY